MADLAAIAAKGDAQSRRHDRSGNAVEIGKVGTRIVQPLDLALLQLQRLGGDIGNGRDPPAHRVVGLDQEIAGDDGKAERRDDRHAQRQPQFQIASGPNPHWRILRDRRRASARGRGQGRRAH
ncbi:hypothetical protein ACVW0V_008914 [Bradyrhizobium elkanii]